MVLAFSPSDYKKENPPTPQSGASGQATAELMSTVTPPSPLFGSDSHDGSKPVGSAVRPSKATATRNRDTRLPAARTGSIFERLYKTQTAASAASKVWTPVRAEARRGGTFSSPPPVASGSRRTPTSAKSDKTLEDSLKVFQRLHITGTVANTSKRLTPKRHAPSRTMRSPAKITSSTTTPIKSASKRGTVGYVYSPRMKPLTALYFDSKYHPGIGRELVDPIKLGYTFFQMICEYENGGLTSAQIAREIIIAFFKKDFPAGRHWELHEPTVEQRPGEEHAYNVKMCATYDWQDAFRIASAQGVVQCQPEKREISVLNYIYDVSSDL